MNRIERSKENFKKKFGRAYSEEDRPDPDFEEIKNRFLYGDVVCHGNLDDKTGQLITLAVLTTIQTLSRLKEQTAAALNLGLTPDEIKEALYQCAPYIGFAKTQEALDAVNAVFKAQNISLPLESRSSTTEETRFDRGLETQKAIFGAEHIDSMRKTAPTELKHMQDYLSAFCFGDFYTRGALSLQTRELLTFCIISALGGCEPQVKAHAQGNLNVGNNRDMLISAITECLPYIGFPRTLNAIGCINAVTNS